MSAESMLEVARDRPGGELNAAADEFLFAQKEATSMTEPAGSESVDAPRSGGEPAAKAPTTCVALDEKPASMPTELWESLVPHPQWGKWNDQSSSVILTETRVVEL